MRALGDAIRRFGGTVTLLNLTNTPVYHNQFKNVHTLLKGLTELPVIDSVPILTSSDTANQLDDMPSREPHSILLPATGPFFGLEALRTAGEDTSVSHRLGRIAVRPRLVEN